MTREQLKEQRKDFLNKYYPYRMCYYNKFNFKALSNIMYVKRAGRGSNESYNDCIIMADTETSKKYQEESEFYKLETYTEFLEDIKNYTFHYSDTFKEIGNIQQLRAVGIRCSRKSTSNIDVYYEDAKTRFPWIFKNDAYSDVDALYYIYEYLRDKPIAVPEHQHNHVCAWTISIRCFDRNLVTLYGHKPSEMAWTIKRIHESMQGDKTIIYFHNMSYDWVFMRRFLFNEIGVPEKQLSTKPHYPIYFEWPCGIIFKDSLILAQRGLEKWADDLNVEHKKAVGKWDYGKIRNQNHHFTKDELKYIENDTLAGVECLQKTMDELGKHIYSMPYTATGIPREDTRKLGKDHNAKDRFNNQALEYGQQITMQEYVYHGGFTHGNRHFVNHLINHLVKCKDFASSYPFIMLSEKMPGEKFTPYEDCHINDILSMAEDYAFYFKLILINPRLKDDSIPMPALQVSKAVKVINPILDNGRILCASYLEIYLTEADAEVINSLYTWDNHICVDVNFSAKKYLPRWFTDYIYACFTQKTYLKGKDPVAYSIAKAKVNSLYGMCVQRPIRETLIENWDTGEYEEDKSFNPEEEYDKFVKKWTSILPYQWGVWVTAYAFRNLFRLGSCAGTWLYADTDSVFGYDWNEEKVAAYNQSCKDKLLLNGYGPVIHEGREYWLGVAEDDKECCEFKYMGAKRYAYRDTDKYELHITVAGVPKNDGAKCLNNDINKFKPGFIFRGDVTKKNQHKYYFVDDIYIDDDGNETGDSIDLSPCDYELDSFDPIDWQEMFEDEIQIQVYDEMEAFI